MSSSLFYFRFCEALTKSRLFVAIKKTLYFKFHILLSVLNLPRINREWVGVTDTIRSTGFSEVSQGVQLSSGLSSNMYPPFISRPPSSS